MIVHWLSKPESCDKLLFIKDGQVKTVDSEIKVTLGAADPLGGADKVASGG